MAQAVGANYVAPYLGRIADIVKASFGAEDIPGYSPEEADQERGKIAMESAIDAVAAMQTAVTNSGSDMRVLVASIRSASDMSALAARVSGLCCHPGYAVRPAKFAGAKGLVIKGLLGAPDGHPKGSAVLGVYRPVPAVLDLDRTHARQHSIASPCTVLMSKDSRG